MKLAADKVLLEWLDDDYWRYKRAVSATLSQTDIEKLKLKAASLKAEVQRMFNQVISECEPTTPGNVSTTTPDSNNGLPQTTIVDKLTDELIHVGKLITGYISTSAIYCFGQRTETKTNDFPLSSQQESGAYTHYYLLVITEENKTNAIADLENLVTNQNQRALSRNGITAQGNRTAAAHRPPAVFLPSGSDQRLVNVRR
ncbi:hypothetical protein [Flavobacterium sp. 3HN19-14]|uniref:hypothetical protein n=1 Tax=Flavobacterium sp. 3HN19-14 TaxID=3448133 RepID=UPI003EE36642